MANNRYIRIFSLPENLYSNTAPIIICAGALLSDSATGNYIAQLKFQSVSQKIIKTVSVKIYPQKDNGISIIPISYQYLNLNIKRDIVFGDRDAIILGPDTVNSFGVSVDNVLFEDGTTWVSSNNTNWTNSIEAKEAYIQQTADNEELLKQFKIEYGPSAIYKPIIKDDYWICTCGAFNHSNEESCHVCSKKFNDIANLSLEQLQKAAQERCAREEITNKQNKEKRRIAFLSICLIALLITGIIGGISIHKNNLVKQDLEEMQLLFDSEAYDDAYAIVKSYSNTKSFSEVKSYFNTIAENAIKNVANSGDSRKAFELYDCLKAKADIPSTIQDYICEHCAHQYVEVGSFNSRTENGRCTYFEYECELCGHYYKKAVLKSFTTIQEIAQRNNNNKEEAKSISENNTSDNTTIAITDSTQSTPSTIDKMIAFIKNNADDVAIDSLHYEIGPSNNNRYKNQFYLRYDAEDDNITLQCLRDTFPYNHNGEDMTINIEFYIDFSNDKKSHEVWGRTYKSFEGKGNQYTLFYNGTINTDYSQGSSIDWTFSGNEEEWLKDFFWQYEPTVMDDMLKYLSNMLNNSNAGVSLSDYGFTNY